jgi:SAM-dependent methyltransferase
MSIVTFAIVPPPPSRISKTAAGRETHRRDPRSLPTVQREDWSWIAHEGMDLMSPLAPAKVDEVVGLLELSPGARVVDLGCGKGELLLRIAERYPIRGLGVDRSPKLLELARDAAAARVPEAELTFVERDLAAFEAPEPFDLAIGVGASVGGYHATMARLAALVREGGLVLLGEGYWRREPDALYLDALGATPDEMTDYAGTIAAGAEHGLTPLYAVTASVDDFDRYEWRWSRNGERYAAAHPGEPGVNELLAWIRNGRRRYGELGGRETLGFGLFLFARSASA